MIEMRVVAYKYGAIAVAFAHRMAHGSEQGGEGFPLGNGAAQWVKGLYTREIEGGLLDVRALKGQHVEREGIIDGQGAVIFDAQKHRGNFKEGVRIFVEAAGFDINDDG
jgi:hypothetical protein